MTWSSYLTQRSMIALISSKRSANANRISKIHSNTSRILNNKNRSTRGSLKNSISFLPMKTNKLMNQSLLFLRSISTLSIKLRNSDKKSKRLRQKCNSSPPLIHFTLMKDFTLRNLLIIIIIPIISVISIIYLILN